jgi:hypothetical protein
LRCQVKGQIAKVKRLTVELEPKLPSLGAIGRVVTPLTPYEEFEDEGAMFDAHRAASQWFGSA